MDLLFQKVEEESKTDKTIIILTGSKENSKKFINIFNERQKNIVGAESISARKRCKCFIRTDMESAPTREHNNFRRQSIKWF